MCLHFSKLHIPLLHTQMKIYCKETRFSSLNQIVMGNVADEKILEHSVFLKAASHPVFVI